MMLGNLRWSLFNLKRIILCNQSYNNDSTIISIPVAFWHDFWNLLVSKFYLIIVCYKVYQIQCSCKHFLHNSDYQRIYIFDQFNKTDLMITT
jgi:dTDP-4-dehydrorhamnose 3,5-epimerase-like enzyme